MPSFHKLDAFAKPRHDLQSRSALGGIITLIAALTTALLFLGEVYNYFGGFTRHSLHLSRSMSNPVLPIVAKGNNNINDNNAIRFHHQRNKIGVEASIIFPYMSCQQLDFKLGEGEFSHAKGTIQWAYGVEQIVKLREPNHKEMHLATKSTGKVDNSEPQKTWSRRKDNKEGCTIEAKLRVPMNAGDFAVTITRQAWSDATARVMFNMIHQRGGFGAFGGYGLNAGSGPVNLGLNLSYYVQYIRFNNRARLEGGGNSGGEEGTAISEQSHIIENDYGGVALHQVQIRLIPTIYRNWLNFWGLFYQRGRYRKTYAASIVEHTVQPETLLGGVPLFPGLTVSYDFSPIAVHQVEMRDNFFVFLGNLISIAGGVFVTVGLVVGCVFHTAAAAVSKKMD